MKKLLPLLIVLFAAPLYGQTPKSENFSTEYWSHLAGPTEGAKGFTLLSRDIKLNGSNQYELWVKIVPTNRGVFNKGYSLPVETAYVLQHATVDCVKNLLQFERTTVYDSGDKVVKSRLSPAFLPSKKARIRPGSIGEAVYTNVCIKP